MAKMTRTNKLKMLRQNPNILWVVLRLLKSHVYFIREGNNGPIKIGYGEDVLERMYLFQIGNSSWLHMHATEPGGKSRESFYHLFFNRLRIRGEWFHPEPELLDYIKVHANVWTTAQREASRKAYTNVDFFRGEAAAEGLTAHAHVSELLRRAVGGQ